MKYTRLRTRLHIYVRSITSGTRQRRFDLKEPAAFIWGEYVCNVCRFNACRDKGFSGRRFTGRLHNAILRHNDCNALMHFRSVHWSADWRCLESLFSRLPFACERFSLGSSALNCTNKNWPYRRANNASNSLYYRIVCHVLIIIYRDMLWLLSLICIIILLMYNQIFMLFSVSFLFSKHLCQM